jgi:hypothetical protein
MFMGFLLQHPLKIHNYSFFLENQNSTCNGFQTLVSRGCKYIIHFSELKHMWITYNSRNKVQQPIPDPIPFYGTYKFLYFCDTIA